MLLAAVLSSTAPAAGEEPLPYPPESVLLFVAAWCAPCHGELGHLAEITGGARPYRVLVVPVDDSRATRLMLEQVPRTARWDPETGIQRRLWRTISEETAGLPYSLAIGADGQVCGRHQEALTAATAQALVARCKR
ncbi:TlpA family protein disulfide reductase [Sphingomonas elodea]|uniref:TlpA family protein disulfide reductase n=1 Tax=Sphingomonas elodea TaxID=179878 RepID=UPI000497BE69|nr:hypothetical protein [Sphingomonas elodea]